MPVPAPCQSAFDKALATPTYRSEGDRWQLYVDRDLQAIFGNDDALGLMDLVQRWARLMREKFPKGAWAAGPDGSIIARHYEGAGNLLHWGLVFELVTQHAGSDGKPLWRRARTEPSFVIDPKRGWATFRIRGLPPEQQAAQYRREEKLRRLHATLDRKAREAADATVRRSLDYTLSRDPDAVVEGGLLKRLPDICRDRPVAEVRSVIEETHHRLGLNRRDLALWLSEVENFGMILRERRIMAQFRTAPVEPSKPVPPVPAEIPAEDEAALAGLL